MQRYTARDFRRGIKAQVSFYGKRRERAREVTAEMSSEDDCSRQMLLKRISDAKLEPLMLQPDGEDVFESQNDGKGSVKKSTETQMSSHSKSEFFLEVPNHSAGPKVKGSPTETDDDDELTVVKIEKLLNRIVVRRQRAHLLGLIENGGRARTARLVSDYNAKLAKN